jgi:hypothetical protein
MGGAFFYWGVDRTSACFLNKPSPTLWFSVEYSWGSLGAATVFGEVGFLAIGVKCLLGLQIEKERAMKILPEH